METTIKQFIMDTKITQVYFFTGQNSMPTFLIRNVFVSFNFCKETKRDQMKGSKKAPPPPPQKKKDKQAH
jgi:hypothetical protein